MEHNELTDAELRNFTLGELRVSQKEDGLGTLHGVPGIPYLSWSEDLGGFLERIMPSAVENALGKYDVVCCRDHETHLVLGRESAGNLQLEHTETGLNYHVDLPDTSYAKDLLVSVGRGDVRGSSFIFRVLKDGWFSAEDGLDRREVYEMELYELGPVTMPAYPQTSLLLRSLDGLDYRALSVAITRARTGALEQHHIDVITSAIEALQRYLPAGEQEPPADAEDATQERWRLLKRLELARIK
jgi:uncharacterized protein